MTERPLSRRVIEIVLVAALAVLLAIVSRRLATAIQDSWDLAYALVGAVLGVMLTDFISGLVHWLCDTYGDEHTPAIGPMLIAPFREHHRYPQRILELPLLEVNFSSCAAGVAGFAILVPLSSPQPGAPATALGQGCLLALGLTVYLTNTFHQWSHDPRSPRIARVFQKLRLSIGPRHHARHHASGYGAFCITTGWLNPLLDSLRVFPIVERLMARFLAVENGARTGR